MYSYARVSSSSFPLLGPPWSEKKILQLLVLPVAPHDFWGVSAAALIGVHCFYGEEVFHKPKSVFMVLNSGREA